MLIPFSSVLLATKRKFGVTGQKMQQDAFSVQAMTYSVMFPILQSRSNGPLFGVLESVPDECPFLTSSA